MRVETRSRWLSAIIPAILLAVAFLVFPAQSQAAEAVDVCNPTATNGCVSGLLQDTSQKPIAGVTITLSGTEKATTTSASDGRWAFSVESNGTYTVTIDSSVASKYGLAASSATVKINKSSFSLQRGVVRFDAASSKSNDESSSSASSSSSSSGTASSESSSSSEESTGSGQSTWWSTVRSRFWQQLFSGLIFGLMLGLMSMGMNLIYGTTGLSSFSHGEQVTLGGLMAYVGTQMMHMPLWASALFAILVGGLTGWIQNDLVWAPLRRRHVGTMQQMIVTIGLSMALQYTYQFFFGGSTLGITVDVPGGFQIGPITTDAPTLLSAGLAIAVIAGVTFFLYRTRTGRATRAVSDNASLAAASGINVERVVRVVWIMSTSLAALSGVLIGIYLNGVAWNTGALLLLLMFSAVTLGGLGTANGALVGSLIIGVVADMSSLIIPNDMRYASALAILIIVLLFRPQGLFGKRQRVG
ncbi:carboxypeptidase regulatory-like domain-containing protein [uncultured Bifidobacterium sp.]|uniref:ABC transporter permease subunit n=1 Tax=uncultured Bifidobacterium sp. TaxID=165187 RepID=UPI00262CD66E|nr:carboxypeptidase regulatory-like domain-containing protein [uncultured Bifidobacterium sp.]